MQKGSKMRILMVLLDNFYPRDPRVRREVKWLLREGYEVTVVSRRADDEPKRETISEGEEVIRIDFPLEKRGGPLYASLYYGILRHRAFTQVLGLKPDLVHVHDLPAAISSFFAAKILGIPMVLDLHEDWPELFLFYSKGRSLTSRSLAYPMYAWLKLEERILLKGVDGLVVISEEFKELLVERGADPSKIEVVHNTIDLEEMKEVEDVKPPEMEGELKVVYVGGIGPHRDLETIIRGVKMLRDHVDAHLYLVGDGFHRRRLERLVESIGASSFVKFTGWLPFKEAMSYVKGSDLCVIPIKDFPEAHISFPNKIQQYMFFSKPVVVAGVRSLSRLAKECGCGFTYTPGDPESFYRAVSRNLGRLEEMGMRGKEHLLRFNWSHSFRNLLSLYRRLAP